MDRTDTFIHLGPPMSKLKIDLYILNIPPPTSSLSTNVIHYLISKPLQNIPHLIIIKLKESLSSIQLQYSF